MIKKKRFFFINKLISLIIDNNNKRNLFTESVIYGAKVCATIPKIWIRDTPCDLTGVGKSSAAYWRLTLAAMFKQNRDKIDIINLAVTVKYIKNKLTY